MGLPETLAKSPKTPRRLKTPPRQVHFASSNKGEEGIQVTTAAEYAAKNNINRAPTTESRNTAGIGTAPCAESDTVTGTQPSSYPALGLPPAAAQQQQPQHQQQQQNLGPGPWFTSAGPSQSTQTVPGVNQLPGAVFTPSTPAPQPAVGGFQSQQPGYVVQPQPAYIQQPVMVNGQPAMVAPAPQFQAMPTAAGGNGFVGGGGPPVFAGNTGPVPEVAGVGRTVGEEQMRQLNFAHSNQMFEPQDFKPSDDDPSRFYYVRELDGNWTQRNRFTIDHMGDCRWYVTDEGWFYAVRLPN